MIVATAIGIKCIPYCCTRMRPLADPLHPPAIHLLPMETEIVIYFATSSPPPLIDTLWIFKEIFILTHHGILLMI